MGVTGKTKNIIEKFLSGERGKRFFHIFYSVGASIVIIGALAKLEHWSFGNLFLTIGLITEGVVFLISAFDQPSKEYQWERVFAVLDTHEEGDRPSFGGGGSGGSSSVVIGGSSSSGSSSSMGGGVAASGSGQSGGAVIVGGGSGSGQGGGAVIVGGGGGSGSGQGGGAVIVGGGGSGSGQGGGAVIVGGGGSGGGNISVEGAESGSSGTMIIGGGGGGFVGGGGSFGGGGFSGGGGTSREDSAVSSPENAVEAVERMTTGQVRQSFGIPNAVEISEEDTNALTSSIKKMAAAADQLAKMAEMTDATQQYMDQLTSMSENMERFSSVTNSLANVSDILLDSYKNITDNSDGINQSSRGYVHQMESLNRNIQGLNTIYEIQLKSVSSQIDAIERINAGLMRIKDLYEGSIVDSSVFRSETEKMAQQLHALNSVYNRLLNAMTMNMYGAGGNPLFNPNPHNL